MKCPHTFHLPKSEMKFHNNRILTQFSAQCTPKAAKWFVMKWYMSVAAQNSLRMTKQWPLTAYQSFVEIYVCICIVFMECTVSDVYPFNFNLEILSIHRYFVVNVALCICSLSPLCVLSCTTNRTILWRRFGFCHRRLWSFCECAYGGRLFRPSNMIRQLWWQRALSILASSSSSSRAGVVGMWKHPGAQPRNSHATIKSTCHECKHKQINAQLTAINSISLCYVFVIVHPSQTKPENNFITQFFMIIYFLPYCLLSCVI